MEIPRSCPLPLAALLSACASSSGVDDGIADGLFHAPASVVNRKSVQSNLTPRPPTGTRSGSPGAIFPSTEWKLETVLMARIVGASTNALLGQWRRSPFRATRVSTFSLQPSTGQPGRTVPLEGQPGGAKRGPTEGAESGTRRWGGATIGVRFSLE
ncbi:hypothetical protein NEUTE1DRAFT_100892 [Neurospora tetrasperma FGSC 2508]|uniref:Uncharacterized protein n=1 Tax=Neurospora tetrasperma (strain FGSC 2508 / ATCC MYA-4615 / P0657) TaxID=510951 RepID=F8MMZ1_NEUT8|nr:uncharacterized protein NEUTE1DRAFT_100892 [Neurospora tetrasperma FGSC 2508]EGO58015.1 hypothetical protein NEUTE1DRAFT_100892 [Neurospora tetrasperma FGSC 2508]